METQRITYEIVKGIPIPPPSERQKPKGKESPYPFRKMEVGDSIGPITKNSAGNPLGKFTLRSLVTSWNKRTGFTFEFREEEEGGYRIWRTK